MVLLYWSDLSSSPPPRLSGYFLPHKNIEGKDVYVEEIKSIFAISNATGGLPQECIKHQSQGDEYLCNFAAYAYAYTKEASFPINSALDSWQTKCICASTMW